MTTLRSILSDLLADGIPGCVTNVNIGGGIKCDAKLVSRLIHRGNASDTNLQYVANLLIRRGKFCME